MSLIDSANIPIEMSLADRTFKVKRLTIKELFGNAQAKIISRARDNIRETASLLSGNEKMDFLCRATKNLPEGDELNRLAGEYNQSAIGVSELLMIGLNKCQTVSEDEISQIVNNATIEQQISMVAYLNGSDPEKAVKSYQKDKEEEKKILEAAKSVV